MILKFKTTILKIKLSKMGLFCILTKLSRLLEKGETTPKLKVYVLDNFFVFRRTMSSVNLAFFVLRLVVQSELGTRYFKSSGDIDNDILQTK